MARDQFVLTRLALRMLIGRYLGRPPASLVFDYTDLGRPILGGADEDAAIAFSVAHSRTQALLAFTNGLPVGIDVECVRVEADCDSIAECYFAEGERASLAALPPADRREAFFACWTRKEALLKATGLGISMGLALVELGCAPDDPPAIVHSTLADIDPAAWSLHDLDVGPSYKAALAVRTRQPAIAVFRMPATEVVGDQGLLTIASQPGAMSTSA